MDELSDHLQEMEMDPAAELEFARLHGAGKTSHDPVLAAIGKTLKPGGLTMKETMFAMKVAETGKISASYREVYEVSHLGQRSVQTMALRVAQRPAVAHKIAEYREQMRVAVEQSVPSLIATVHEAIEMARVNQDPKAMLAAVDRLSGLLGLGENQKRRESGVVVLDLDPETRKKLEQEIVRTYALEGDAIDVTPDIEPKAV
jgi:hypothetical protein